MDKAAAKWPRVRVLCESELLNFADLSRTMALPQTTLKRYFALLEGTFLIQLLRPWVRNLGKRVIQTPKIYLNDSGLLTYSLGATVDRLKTEGNLAGDVLENFMMMELRKQCAQSGAEPKFSSGEQQRALLRLLADR